jgi:AcrR family transcriptional regulator
MTSLGQPLHIVNIAFVKRPFHHGDLSSALVKAAKQIIERKGIEAFALREAARNVGVSANAAYRHFEDKDALLSAVASSSGGGLCDVPRIAEETRLT